MYDGNDYDKGGHDANNWQKCDDREKVLIVMNIWTDSVMIRKLFPSEKTMNCYLWLEHFH